MTIIEAIQDEKLFPPLAQRSVTWKAWMVVLRAIFGLQMDEADKALFVELTGRTWKPQTHRREKSGCASGDEAANRESWR